MGQIKKKLKQNKILLYMPSVLVFQNSPQYKFSLFEGKPSKQPLFLCLKSQGLAKQWFSMEHMDKLMGTTRSFA